MGFFKSLFGSSNDSLQVPDHLRILVEEMKKHALDKFSEGEEPSVYDMKLYDGRIAIQCEYELSHWKNYNLKRDKPEQLHVSISFPHSDPHEQDIDLITIAFFDCIEGVKKEFGASGGADVIHLKRNV